MFGIAVASGATLAAKLKAVIVVLEDEVDDARDGVRTVHGRVTAGHDVDTVDEVGRDRVDVDTDARAAGRRRRRDGGR